MKMCWVQLVSALHFVAVPLSELMVACVSAHPSFLSKCNTVTGLQMAWHALAWGTEPARLAFYHTDWQHISLDQRITLSTPQVAAAWPLAAITPQAWQQCLLLMWHNIVLVPLLKMKSKITHFHLDLTLLPFLSLTHTHTLLKSDTSRLWMCTHHTSHQPLVC